MYELIQVLDPCLEYESHSFTNHTFTITVSSTRLEVPCPYCGQVSSRVHSLYPRKFQDLPIQGHKVQIKMQNRKFLCKNPECDHRTFSERFECIAEKATRTKRLEEEVLSIAIHCSSITAIKLIRKGTANIGKSTICNLLHKERLKP